jgi:hypothetical protein
VEVTKQDLMAMVDVFDALEVEADDLSVEDAVEILRVADLVAAAMKRATSMVETAAKQQLEKPKTIGSKRYVRVRTYKKRWSHYRLASMVVDKVKVNHETGEVPSAQEAAAQALNHFIKLYCSDSTTPKVTQIRRLLGVADAMEEGLVTEEAHGTEIAVFDLEGPGCSDDE